METLNKTIDSSLSRYLAGSSLEDPIGFFGWDYQLKLSVDALLNTYEVFSSWFEYNCVAFENARNVGRIQDKFQRFGDLTKPNACFCNSLSLQYTNDELSYFEGFYKWADIDRWLIHGWCVTPENEIVDVSTMNKDTEPTHRIGVRIPKEYTDSCWNDAALQTPLLPHYFEKMNKDSLIF